jgi:hypothetical protein
MATIQFNNGNPFAVGPGGVHSAQRTLPARVGTVTLQILDPLGDWVNPANAGGTFVYGIEYTTDGGQTWQTLAGNGSGQAVGTLFKGHLPMVGIVGDALDVANNQPCRAFAFCTPQTITIAATATVT